MRSDQPQLEHKVRIHKRKPEFNVARKKETKMIAILVFLPADDYDMNL